MAGGAYGVEIQRLAQHLPASRRIAQSGGEGRGVPGCAATASGLRPRPILQPDRARPRSPRSARLRPSPAESRPSRAARPLHCNDNRHRARDRCRRAPRPALRYGRPTPGEPAPIRQGYTEVNPASWDPNPRLSFWDSAGFAEKSLILLLFCRDGKFHPRGAGEGNDGPVGF